MNILKIKLQKCYNVKEKPIYMEQIQMEYWDIEKMNQLNFLNKEFGELTNIQSQSLANWKSRVYVEKKPSNIVSEAKADHVFSFSFQHGDQSELNIWLHSYMYQDVDV